MHIAFVDFVPWDYTIETVYQKPLGGSQSALCYLAEELARRGHEVQLINNAALPGVSRGVVCLPAAKAQGDVWKSFDLVVLLNSVKPGLSIRPLLRNGARLIAWIQHAHDQPAVQPLAREEVRSAFDGFALLSDWQRGCFERTFQIDPARVRVLRNAVSPAFLARFPPGADIVAAKRRPPVLAYTSTPFRGLDILVHAFPAIRRDVRGATLRVYSSMQVYQAADESDSAQYGHLYELCRDTPGVEYIGSLAQPELAEQLREVAMLAYPNHFAETSCIAVMEAMASGCRIVTSELGALPETTAGFARLIPVGDDWLTYSDRFIDETVRTLEEFETQPGKVNDLLNRQVAYINAECTWPRRADQWEAWLAES
ncbi:MAG TPA: glycosyltransferase family 4 protein [Pirellulales bacterium]|jgi:glycosyltransferase involved in cell wall biosynthesis|nr:glycosyltransferase family 4 protein [Pirellulales bacterium]